jgi:hypothetical protein
VHLTPTSSSWLNQVERFFALLTDNKIRRGVYRSVAALRADIAAFIDRHNADPKPFRWTKPADDILASIERFCRLQCPGKRRRGVANFWFGTLEADPYPHPLWFRAGVYSTLVMLTHDKQYDVGCARSGKRQKCNSDDALSQGIPAHRNPLRNADACFAGFLWSYFPCLPVTANKPYSRLTRQMNTLRKRASVWPVRARDP